MCLGEDIFLYSGTNRTGSEICFYASGTTSPGEGPSAEAILADYTFLSCAGRCHEVWGGNVASYWPGGNQTGASPGCLGSKQRIQRVWRHVWLLQFLGRSGGHERA
jgi:hypothetical protein